VTLMVAGAQGGGYALGLWMPTYLRAVRGLSATSTGGFWCSEASCHSSGCKSRQHKESSPCCSDTQRQGG
jgi:hypothetical protein